MMPAKTKEDKKRDILEYIQKESSNRGNYLNLERNEIVDKFSDEYYNSKQVKEILDELIEDEPIKSENFKLELLYTETEGKKIEENFIILNKQKIFFILGVGFYIYMVFLRADDGMNTFLGGASDFNILISSVFGTGFAYVSGRFILWFGDFVSEKSTIIRDHKHFVGATVILWAFGGLAIWMYSLEKAVPPVVITYVPTSIAAAVAYARYVKGENT
jgi:hypothetical protein